MKVDNGASGRGDEGVTIPAALGDGCEQLEDTGGTFDRVYKKLLGDNGLMYSGVIDHGRRVACQWPINIQKRAAPARHNPLRRHEGVESSHWRPVRGTEMCASSCGYDRASGASATLLGRKIEWPASMDRRRRVAAAAFLLFSARRDACFSCVSWRERRSLAPPAAREASTARMIARTSSALVALLGRRPPGPGPAPRVSAPGDATDATLARRPAAGAAAVGSPAIVTVVMSSAPGEPGPVCDGEAGVATMLARRAAVWTE